MKTLEQKVMARVKRMYYLRMVVNPTSLKLYGLAALAGTLLSVVSVASVYANLPGSPLAALSYIGRALIETELVVQCALSGALLLGLLLLRDVVRSMPMQIHLRPQA
jgi:hypothetical protein